MWAYVINHIIESHVTCISDMYYINPTVVTLTARDQFIFNVPYVLKPLDLWYS